MQCERQFMKRRYLLLAIPMLGVLGALLTAGILGAPEAKATDGEKEVSQVVELDSLSEGELSGSIITSSGAGTPIDANAQASEASEDAATTMAARPAKFDLRDATFNGTTGSFVTTVKKQSPWSTCWSFGANAAAETAFLTESGMTFEDSKTEAHPNGLNLSEKHTAWFTTTPIATNYFNQQGEGFLNNPNATVAFGDGMGGRYMAGQTAYATTLFSTLVGPVDESADPSLVYATADGAMESAGDGTFMPDRYGDWSIDENLRHVASMELEESFYLPSPATWTGPQDPVSGAYTGEYKFNQDGLDAIKDQLLQGRAVAISFHADQSLPGQTVTGSQYINLDTWAHYTYDGAVMNHAVCIVGYDDTYPASNFLADHQPEGDGAFIVKNSWGSLQSPDWEVFDWGIDGTGYFYLSYCDHSLSYPEAFDFVTPNDDDLTFGKGDDAEVVDEYQYAFMPGDPEAKSYENVVSSANIYEIGSKSIIRDAAVQTRSLGTDVRYDLYLLNKDATTPTDGELLWSKDVHYEYGGFHRAEIDQPVTANAGDRIGVVITTTLPDGNYEIQQNKRVSRHYMMAIMADPRTRRGARPW